MAPSREVILRLFVSGRSVRGPPAAPPTPDAPLATAGPSPGLAIDDTPAVTEPTPEAAPGPAPTAAPVFAALLADIRANLA